MRYTEEQKEFRKLVLQLEKENTDEAQPSMEGLIESVKKDVLLVGKDINMKSRFIKTIHEPFKLAVDMEPVGLFLPDVRRFFMKYSKPNMKTSFPVLCHT